MSKEHPLTRWIAKADALPSPPARDEQRPRLPKKTYKQLNLKVSDELYARVKCLAHRDRLSLVDLLQQCVTAYEERDASKK